MGSEEMQERLLDAVETCLERHGVRKTTVGSIAAVAGVSRGFVYKHFGSKDGVVLAMLVRRAERFNERARAFLESQANVTESIVEGILLAVRTADLDPYFGLLVGAATLDPANRVKGSTEEALRLSGQLWRPVLEAAQKRGELKRELPLDDLVQWIMYLELVLLGARRSLGEDESSQERQLRTLFVPALFAKRAPALRSVAVRRRRARSR
jgi:AcrR family transcriptional regulator